MKPMPKNTILWADDDYDDLQMMREVLAGKNSDFKIAEVHNGREALDFLEQCPQLPCLIILDINMPVLDGKETLSILKNTEKYKNIPVVMFTTSDSELDKIYCNRLNTEMVTKPPTFNTLTSVMEKLLNFCK